MRLLSEIMNKEEKTKNDVEWEKIFERYDILSHIYNEGAFLISADQIKEYREPRLMVKFDHKINLPEPFRKIILRFCLFQGKNILFLALRHITNLKK